LLFEGKNNPGYFKLWGWSTQLQLHVLFPQDATVMYYRSVG